MNKASSYYTRTSQNKGERMFNEEQQKQRRQKTQIQEEEDDSIGLKIYSQVYYQGSGLTNFMILNDIKRNFTFPVGNIRVSFRNLYLNEFMRRFFAEELEQPCANMEQFAFRFQNTFFTKILYSGAFNNVYCACTKISDGKMLLRFDTDVSDSYLLKFAKFNKSPCHRFSILGAHAQLNGVFGFCEKISYQADAALLFDNQLRHRAKYVLSIPFLGNIGSLRASSSSLKKRIDPGSQLKRRRKKVYFYPFEWQNTHITYSYNSFTSSHFEPFTSDSQRIYFLSMDYGINRIFRSRQARKFFNQVNDAIFLNNRLVSKDYTQQHEIKIVYNIPEQRFQFCPKNLLKYSYSLHTKCFLGSTVGIKSVLKAQCTYFEKNRFLFTSALETGMLTSLDSTQPPQSLSSEGQTNDNASCSEEFPNNNVTNIVNNRADACLNVFNLQNIPGYYQLYRANQNMSFFLALRNKLYFRQWQLFGFKSFLHANFYIGNAPSQPVLNCGVGISRHFDLLDCKVDFLFNSSNLLPCNTQFDNEFAQFQIIFNS